MRSTLELIGHKVMVKVHRRSGKLPRKREQQQQPQHRVASKLRLQGQSCGIRQSARAEASPLRFFSILPEKKSFNGPLALCLQFPKLKFLQHLKRTPVGCSFKILILTQNQQHTFHVKQKKHPAGPRLRTSKPY